jgi:long-chain acyl-CoA synthetase
MRIMRDDGTIGGPEDVGEIVIRGHNVMKGYYKKPNATEEAIVDGWLHTGDMAKMDEEGYFFIVDRKKDIIIRGGMNIYPREIEEVLFTHPGVLEVAVIGVPDEIRGEEVTAYVALVPDAETTVEGLDSFCKERLAKFKCPKTFVLVPELPKGPTGKVLKRELRNMATSGATA